MTSPNKLAAPNPAIASQLPVGHHWRGIGEPDRWTGRVDCWQTSGNISSKKENVMNVKHPSQILLLAAFIAHGGPFNAAATGVYFSRLT
jgi:hypothetical protein